MKFAFWVANFARPKIDVCNVLISFTFAIKDNGIKVTTQHTFIGKLQNNLN